MAKKLLIETLRKKIHRESYLVECKTFRDSKKAPFGMLFHSLLCCVFSCHVVSCLFVSFRVLFCF